MKEEYTKLLNLVKGRPGVRLHELVAILGIPKPTIRYRLIELERKNLVRLVSKPNYLAAYPRGHSP